MVLHLSREQYDDIVAHAREDFPSECCGLLAGREGQVLRIMRGRNADASPFTYRLDDRQLFQFHKEMDEAGLDIVGIYHSHTASEAVPSRTDVARAFYPEAVYIIISLQDWDRPVVRGFHITDGTVAEEDVVVR